MAHKSDAEIVATTHNTARFFTEHRQVALVLLFATFAWGWFGYQQMPKRKDPNILVRVAVAICQWPGATAEQVEQLVTRPIENTIAQNAYIKPPSGSDYGIRSLSFPGLSLVFVKLDEGISDTRKQFSDILEWGQCLRVGELHPRNHSIRRSVRVRPGGADAFRFCAIRRRDFRLDLRLGVGFGYRRLRRADPQLRSLDVDHRFDGREHARPGAAVRVARRRRDRRRGTPVGRFGAGRSEQHGDGRQLARVPVRGAGFGAGQPLRQYGERQWR